MTDSGKVPANFSQLSEAEQRQVAERLLRIEESGWKPFWCPDPECPGDPHTQPDGTVDPNWSHQHARPDQRLPSWLKPWILLLLSGRGSGKTRTGVEFVTLCARKGLDGAILGRRGTELVNTHVATLIEQAHPEFVPVHWSSKDLLEWPNGALTYLFSAEKPENIRSVNLSYAWVDEAAHMDEIETAWMNLKLATRIEKPGNPIHILITSTPTGTPWMMKMEDDPNVEVRRVSTYANWKNLSKDYLEALRKEFEGTRMGQQELHGVVLRDVEGALWNDSMFVHHRIDTFEQFEDAVDGMDDRVLAVDPAGSKGPRSDAHGIIGVGVHYTGDSGLPLSVPTFGVLCDATLKGNQTEMCRQVFKAAQMIKASRIIVEKNFGGESVKQNLRDHARQHPDEAMTEDGDNLADTVVLEHASQSKETRAEPTVGKYEQGRVVHHTNPTMFGDLSALEQRQVGWVPKSRGGKMPSPNEIDALVWGVRALDKGQRFSTQQASSREVREKLKRSSPATP